MHQVRISTAFWKGQLMNVALLHAFDAVRKYYLASESSTGKTFEPKNLAQRVGVWKRLLETGGKGERREKGKDVQYALD